MVTELRDHVSDLVGIVNRLADQIPSLTVASELTTEASNTVGDAMLALERLDRELARAKEESERDVIECLSLRLHVGGYTEKAEDLLCTLAETASDLEDLRSASVDLSREARWRTHDRLAARLLTVFRVATEFRETFKAIEHLAATA